MHVRADHLDGGPDPARAGAIGAAGAQAERAERQALAAIRHLRAAEIDRPQSGEARLAAGDRQGQLGRAGVFLDHHAALHPVAGAGGLLVRCVHVCGFVAQAPAGAPAGSQTRLDPA